MTIQNSGYVKISTLDTAKNAKDNTPHQAALETIYEITRRNIKINGGTAAAINTNIGNGKYVGWAATQGMEVRSCHGDANLSFTINGTTYNSVEPIANAQFQAGNVEKIWWDYARNAVTHHVPNPASNMAAFVEFNCATFTHQTLLTNLQNQTKFTIGPANANPRIAIAAAGTGILPEADGPRVLWHIIGDFFVYSPDHYGKGYVVMDDNNDLFQTRNFF